MAKILVSACLLGARVRYDGAIKSLPFSQIQELGRRATLIPFCPEVSGGLPIPRPPAERMGAQIYTRDGTDVTAAFSQGAKAAVKLAVKEGIEFALMKERSPSCGVHAIFDGRFHGCTIDGEGMTTCALREIGVRVYSEDEIEALLAALP